MKRVLIVGAGKGVSALLKHLHTTDRVEVIAVIDKDKDAEGLELARTYNIPVDKEWQHWLNTCVDNVSDVTGKEQVLKDFLKARRQKTIVITKAVAYAISELLEEKDELLDHLKIQMNNREIILDNIHDGMIVINDQGIVQFVNKRAEEIVGHSKVDRKSVV